MDSRLRSSRPTFRATSTSSGTGCRQGAIFLRRCGGSKFRRRMVGRGRWGFQLSQIALPRRWPVGGWSPFWSRYSAPTPMATGPANLRSMRCARLASAAGAATGCSTRCVRLLRQYQLGAAPQGGPPAYGVPVGAAIRRALAEGAGADGGRQRRAAHRRNAAGWGDLASPVEPVPALRVRHVDGAELSAYSVRALRGRCHLSLPKRRRGAGAMERACRSSCGLQAGAASGEDEDRLLQGCEPARRLSYHLVRLSGFSISSPEDDLEWKGCPWLHARRQSESVDGHQPDRSALVASSSQRQAPAGAGRDVQSVHSRLDQLLQQLLQDAVASDPEEDRCLCHSPETRRFVKT